jgi:hypothetical protein
VKKSPFDHNNFPGISMNTTLDRCIDVFSQVIKQANSRRFVTAGLLAATGCSLTLQDSLAQTATQFDIQPMTQVNVADHLGYFGDPYPIHVAQWLAPELPQFFSGTTPELLQCQRPIKPGCFSAEPVTLKVSDALKTDAQSAGNVFGDVINRNIYQTLDGAWHMAVTLYVHPKGNSTTRWTVIAHAHPADPAVSLTPPTSWIADTVLVGSLSTFDYANYDGKYLEDGGMLYLIYSKRLEPSQAAHDGIVAQAMIAPDTPGNGDPVVLLAPDNTNGGFNSEYFHTVPPPGDNFKLIETGNITKIAGKYVMAYSAGDYQQKDYKTGIAYSDTLLPQPGHAWRKVLQEDTAGIWGQPHHLEVHYLMQSQQPNWPNYVANQVIAPGVPSIVLEPSGKYLLFFDGFAPGDTPQAPDTPNNKLNIEPDHRRPFFVPLVVDIPASGSVSNATDKELATWITPQGQ